MRNLRIFVAAATLTLFASSATHAAVTLASAFGDHMVIQRDIPVPVFGVGEPGEVLAVTLGSQRRKATVGKDGRWRVAFDALRASDKPIAFKVVSSNTIELSDVLVGEVWLAAGQSNMEWPLSASDGAKVAVAAANHPGIRLLHLEGAARGGSGKYTPAQLERLTDERFFTGQWRACSPKTAAPFSAVGYYFALKLHQELGVPVGVIDVAIGGTPAEAWISREGLSSHPQLAELVKGNWLDNPHLGAWCRGRARSNLSRALAEDDTIPGDDLGPNHSFKPTFCWSSGVEPLVPTAIRGVLWYQGESNAQEAWRVQQHNQLFPLLVSDWRKRWGRSNLPVLFVQLPSMGRPHWPWFREGQRRTLAQIPNTGMAVTIDVGHPTNVHPTNKRPVGERLARWALAKTYRQAIVASGPLMRRVRIEGAAVVVEFDHVGGGLVTTDDATPSGFEIAGEDGVFRAASAKIRGKWVTLQHPTVADPKLVRYAWAPVPQRLNLVNSAGLPASPFTTQTKP